MVTIQVEAELTGTSMEEVMRQIEELALRDSAIEHEINLRLLSRSVRVETKLLLPSTLEQELLNQRTLRRQAYADKAPELLMEATN
jgi:hypothetical protein